MRDAFRSGLATLPAHIACPLLDQLGSSSLLLSTTISLLFYRTSTIFTTLLQRPIMSSPTSSPKQPPVHMLPLRDIDGPIPAPSSTCIQPRSISKARSIRVKLSLRRSPIGLTNTLTIDTGFPPVPLPLKHRPSLPLFSTTPLANPTSSSPTAPVSPPRPAPRRGPLLQLQVTPPTPPKKRREDLIQALREGEAWHVGDNVPRSISRAGAGGVGLEKWSAVKASGLNWGGAATVGRQAGRRGMVGAVGGGGGGVGREGWF